MGSAPRRQPVRTPLRPPLLSGERHAGGKRPLKILAITAGAGQMYCGSCLRDNALASELLARGHDVILMPAYTPTRTDERNVSRPKVLMGGISVYLEHKIPLFRHTPKLLDRLWDASSVIRAASRRSISTDPAMLGDMTVAMLRGENGPHAKEIDKLLDWLAGEPPPDLTVLPNALLISLARPIARATKRPVAVSLQGEDLFLEGLGEPHRSQALDSIRCQVKGVDAFFPVSDAYARFMSDHLAIDPRRMHVVPLGVTTEDLRPRAPRGTKSSAPLRIGYFARVAPEKGLHLLCEAYRVLRGRPGAPETTFEAAGYLAPEHRTYLAEIERRMREWGMADQFRYHGVLDRGPKVEFLRSLDVFSMPATYDEPKGLSVLEAMACGVPVVQPRRGAFPEMLERTGGGLLVDPDNAEALADGLDAILRDALLASRLASAGAAGVREHYSVARMADRALEAYAAVSGRAASH